MCSSDLFYSPKFPKNPYNNQNLSYRTLYNLYFKIKESTRIMPFLIHGFFLNNFKLSHFREQYQPLIMEYNLKNFAFKSTWSDLDTYVTDMLKSNIYTKNLKIHKDFPKQKLVDIFRPYLFHFLIANYYLVGTEKIYTSRRLLYNKLREFYLYNKTFGRKLINRQKNPITGKTTFEYSYNTKHINFYKMNDKRVSLAETIVNTIVNLQNNISNTNNQDFEDDNTVISNNSSTNSSLDDNVLIDNELTNDLYSDEDNSDDEDEDSDEDDESDEDYDEDSDEDDESDEDEDSDEDDEIDEK